MEPQKPIVDEKEANMGPTWVQKGVRKRSKSETLLEVKIELLLQQERSSARDRANGPSKLGRSSKA